MVHGVGSVNNKVHCKRSKSGMVLIMLENIMVLSVLMCLWIVNQFVSTRILNSVSENNEMQMPEIKRYLLIQEGKLLHNQNANNNLIKLTHVHIRN